MSLTPREAFKVGFMLKCADDGLSPAEVQDRVAAAVEILEKRGALEFPQFLKDIQSWHDLGEFQKKVPGYVLAGVPALAGVGLGYGLHKLQGEPIDADDVKKRELIEEYRRWTDRAKDWQKHKTLLPH